MRADEIAYILARRTGSSRWAARKNIAVVPNVSWGFDLSYEADLIVLSKSGYLSEIEIKVSKSDWIADLKKQKHSQKCFKSKIKYFWYAAPDCLAKRWEEIKIETLDLEKGLVINHPFPEYAGVISVSENDIKVLKEAKSSGAKKISIEEQFKLLRLLAIKTWKINYKPEVKNEIKN